MAEDGGGKRRILRSLGRECAAYGCSNREYMLNNRERKPSGISFFNFPRESSIKKEWCNLIRRQDGMDGFHVTNSTRVCEKHFEKTFVYRPPGGTRKRLLEGAKPSLHPWNGFGQDVTELKAPSLERLSQRKICRVSTPEAQGHEKCSNDELGQMRQHQQLSKIDLLKVEMQKLIQENASLKDEKFP